MLAASTFVLKARATAATAAKRCVLMSCLRLEPGFLGVAFSPDQADGHSPEEALQFCDRFRCAALCENVPLRSSVTEFRCVCCASPPNARAVGAVAVFSTKRRHRPESRERDWLALPVLMSRPISTSRFVPLPPTHHGFIAMAQKSFDLSTISAWAKPAAASNSATPCFACPELTVKPSTTMPPCFSTRHTSDSPPRPSDHACIELIASALSND